MKKIIILAIFAISMLGCQTVDHKPQFQNSTLIRGRSALAFEKVDNTNYTVYNICGEAMQFITQNFAVGARASYEGFQSKDFKKTSVNAGPSLIYLFPSEEPGIWPYASGSCGLAQSRLGSETENDIYLAIGGGALFFIHEKWAVDIFAEYKIDADYNRLTVGVGLAVKLGD